MITDFRYFERSRNPVKPNFSENDIQEVIELFQDTSETFNITFVPIEDEFNYRNRRNEYQIGCAMNLYVDIRLHTNIDEVMETLLNNFVPLIESSIDCQFINNLNQCTLQYNYVALSLVFKK